MSRGRLLWAAAWAIALLLIVGGVTAVGLQLEREEAAQAVYEDLAEAGGVADRDTEAAVYRLYAEAQVFTALGTAALTAGLVSVLLVIAAQGLAWERQRRPVELSSSGA